MKQAESGSLVQQSDEGEVSPALPEKDEHLAPGEAAVSGAEAEEEDSDTSLSPDDSNPAISTRIASTSTAGTSDHTHKQNVEIEKRLVAKKQQVIIDQLQEGLEEEQDLSQSLYLQLNSYERETKVLQDELTQARIRLA